MKFWERLEKPFRALAPMVGNSEQAWRTLARRYGTNICYTEMVHSQSFLSSNANPQKNFWYSTSPEDRPLIIQICGNTPAVMLEASLVLQDYCDAIDVNFGCPQDIARRGRYGSFLQDDWVLTEEIVRVLSTNLEVPLTCKIRVFESIEKTVEYARMIERAGCSLLAVHGRTRKQRGANAGLASWEHIKAVKESVAIPVIANGNILYHEDIGRCLDYTGCDGIMVAETHLYNPLIFTGENKTCLEVLGEYLDIVTHNPDSADFRHVKSHIFKLLYTLFRRLPEWRERLDGCTSIDGFVEFHSDIGEEARKLGIEEEFLAMMPYLRRPRL
jgi:tRNA-dihydrouridine synthase 1